MWIYNIEYASASAVQAVAPCKRRARAPGPFCTKVSGI